MVHPAYDEFVRLSAKGLAVPVYREIFADFDTPVSAFSKIDDGRYAFLLESVEGGEQWGRYSFLGSRPEAVFRAHKGKLTLERDGKTETLEGTDPFAALDRLLEERKAVDLPGLPRFAGGAVGFFAYDAVRHLEKLPATLKDDLDVPDAVFHFTDVHVIFDQHRHVMQVVTHARAGTKEAYDDAVARVDAEIARLTGPPRREPPVSDRKPAGAPETTLGRERFEQAVERAKEYIRAGDIFQVVLSHRMSADVSIPAFDAYRALRVVNPSPYMYFLDFGDFEIAGASPEPLVKVTGRRVETRPIAGTYPRGGDEEEDRRQAERLLQDPKERAEHVMLVDLGRNDLGRVCEYGSVNVDELMVVETYSHVLHIVSQVSGTLREEVSAMDVLRSVLPAGTLSGAPKVRAMQIIDELEPHKRGPYGGAVGYLSYTGDLDTAIYIRSVVVKDGLVHVQAGGGTVADAQPAYEFNESVNKAKAVFRAVELAAEQPEWP